MFALTTVIKNQRVPHAVERYSGPDRLALGSDVVIVAILVAIVCVVVIGGRDAGLPGPVGTIHNTSIQAMIGASGAIVVLNVIAGVVKWKRSKERDKEREETRVAEKAGEEWRRLRLEDLDRAICPKLLNALPQVQGDFLGGFNDSFPTGLCMSSQFHLSGAFITGVTMTRRNNCILGVPLMARAQDLRQVEPSAPRSFQTLDEQEAECESLSDPANWTEAQVKEFAAKLKLEDLACDLTVENFNLILAREYNIPSGQLAKKEEFEAAIEWYARVRAGQHHPDQQQQFLLPRCAVAEGHHLRALADYYVFQYVCKNDPGAAGRKERLKGSLEHIARYDNWAVQQASEMGLNQVVISCVDDTVNV